MALFADAADAARAQGPRSSFAKLAGGELRRKGDLATRAVGAWHGYSFADGRVADRLRPSVASAYYQPGAGPRRGAETAAGDGGERQDDDGDDDDD